ncbi:MAG: 3-phosphoglycerate dehydrogenase, partial [Patescibacteria group bacterium]|nr:3-phosphoglycerate dehydrogenase [Patescibacteria group bacterium]
MNKILVTDSLFIHEQHVARLLEAGYEVERLNEVKASEDQLVEAIKGKVGYILGGIEKVTQRVIDAADELKVISFTGIGVKDFVPAWEYAASKGIAVTNAPSGPTHPVAEWAITAALMMNRHFLELGSTGSSDFMTTPGLEGQRVGIIGYGRIGQEIARMIQPFKPSRVTYTSLHRHDDVEPLAEFACMEELLGNNDVIFLCVSTEAGEGYIGAEQLSQMKDGTLLVSFTHDGVIDSPSLLKELQAKRIRAIVDNPM